LPCKRKAGSGTYRTPGAWLFLSKAAGAVLRFLLRQEKKQWADFMPYRQMEDFYYLPAGMSPGLHADSCDSATGSSAASLSRKVLFLPTAKSGRHGGKSTPGVQARLAVTRQKLAAKDRQRTWTKCCR